MEAEQCRGAFQNVDQLSGHADGSKWQPGGAVTPPATMVFACIC